MFGNRINQIKGDKLDVSVMVDIEIVAFGNYENPIITRRGPFNVKMPKISQNDLYKYLMYVLLNSDFSEFLLVHTEVYFSHSTMKKGGFL